MALVRAVADKKGARGLGAEQQVRLAAGYGTPVESALLQLAHGVHHQLVLALGAEGLEAQAGVQGRLIPAAGNLLWVTMAHGASVDLRGGGCSCFAASAQRPLPHPGG